MRLASFLRRSVNAMADHELIVTCSASEGGWRCTVIVGDDAAATEHVVEVDHMTLDDLAPDAPPEELVRESFVYLLEREPRESIMRSFELPMIARFFGDYPDEISHRLRGR